jgi:hypothetical protein
MTADWARIDRIVREPLGPVVHRAASDHRPGSSFIVSASSPDFPAPTFLSTGGILLLLRFMSSPLRSVRTRGMHSRKRSAPATGAASTNSTVTGSPSRYVADLP